jgi:hypothetical protein
LIDNDFDGVLVTEVIAELKFQLEGESSGRREEIALQSSLPSAGFQAARGNQLRGMRILLTQ